LALFWGTSRENNCHIRPENRAQVIYLNGYQAFMRKACVTTNAPVSGDSFGAFFSVACTAQIGTVARRHMICQLRDSTSRSIEISGFFPATNPSGGLSYARSRHQIGQRFGGQPHWKAELISALRNDFSNQPETFSANGFTFFRAGFCCLDRANPVQSSHRLWPADLRGFPGSQKTGRQRQRMILERFEC
jgi:hypothetical protein